LSLENQNINLLLEQCKQQNEKAQFAIYNLYSNAMYNVAYRILGNQVEAEDIMQDSFLKAFTKIETHHASATFGAWLKRIVINKSINELKKSKAFVTELISENFEQIDDSGTEISFVNQKAAAILKTIQSLKPNYKVILTLFFVEGYDLEEISEILKISYGNCRTTMSRAIENLRKKMKEE
jgi:RNA polymerase sigma factor (sigma-70 family)